MSSKLHLLGAVASLSLLATGAHAATVYSNDFSSNSTGFTLSDAELTTAPKGEHFVELNDFGSSATLGLDTSAYIGQTLTVGFTIDVVGSMDGDAQAGGGGGDFFNVASGSSTLFHYNFANYGGPNTQDYPTAGSAPTSGNNGINTLGYTGFPDSGNGVQDSIYNVSVTLTPTSSSTDLVFTSFANEGPGNEFYGFDNVVVTGTPTVSAAPEPASWALMLAGVGMMGGMMRVARRRGSVAALTA